MSAATSRFCIIRWIHQSAPYGSQLFDLAVPRVLQLRSSRIHTERRLISMLRFRRLILSQTDLLSSNRCTRGRQTQQPFILNQVNRLVSAALSNCIHLGLMFISVSVRRSYHPGHLRIAIESLLLREIIALEVRS